MEMQIKETQLDPFVNKSERRKKEAILQSEPTSPEYVGIQRPRLQLLKSPKDKTKQKYSGSVIKLKECENFSTIPMNNLKQNKSITIPESEISTFGKKAQSRSIESAID